MLVLNTGSLKQLQCIVINLLLKMLQFIEENLLFVAVVLKIFLTNFTKRDFKKSDKKHKTSRLTKKNPHGKILPYSHPLKHTVEGPFKQSDMQD